MAFGPIDIELIPTLSSFPSMVSDKKKAASKCQTHIHVCIYIYKNVLNQIYCSKTWWF